MSVTDLPAPDGTRGGASQAASMNPERESGALPLADLVVEPCPGIKQEVELWRPGIGDGLNADGPAVLEARCDSSQLCTFPDLTPGYHRVVQGPASVLVGLNGYKVERTTDHMQVELPCEPRCTILATVTSTLECGDHGWIEFRPEHQEARSPYLRRASWTSGVQSRITGLPCSTMRVAFGNDVCEDGDRALYEGGAELVQRNLRLDWIPYVTVTVIDAETSQPLSGVLVLAATRDSRYSYTDAEGHVQVRGDLWSNIRFSLPGWMEAALTAREVTELKPKVLMRRAREVEVSCWVGDEPCPAKSRLVTMGSAEFGYCEWARPGVWTCDTVDNAVAWARLDETREARAIIPPGASQAEVRFPAEPAQFCLRFDEASGPCELALGGLSPIVGGSAGSSAYTSGQPFFVNAPIGSEADVLLLCEDSTVFARSQVELSRGEKSCFPISGFEPVAYVCLDDEVEAAGEACYLRTELPPLRVSRLTDCPTAVPGGLHRFFCNGEDLGLVNVLPGEDMIVP